MSEPKTELLPTYAEKAAENAARQRQRLAQYLRDCANRVERVQPYKIGANVHSAAAAQVVHEVTSMLANAPFWQLIEDAAEADSAATGAAP